VTKGAHKSRKEKGVAELQNLLSLAQILLEKLHRLLFLVVWKEHEGSRLVDGDVVVADPDVQESSPAELVIFLRY